MPEPQPEPSAPTPDEAEPQKPEVKEPPKKDTCEDERVIIRPYPKAVFLYPLAVCSLACGFLSLAGSATVEPRTVGFVFMCIFLLNMVIISFEFTRYVSVAVVLSVLVMVLLGIQLNERFGVIGYLQTVYGYLYFEAKAGFYFGMFGCFVVIFIAIFVDTRFDYWELRGNEVLHHHGFLGDVQRYPAPSLRLKKEINDVFEYLLLFSGRLVIFPAGSERAIVLENVPRINVLEELITQRLHTLQVKLE
ncbi:hypothetical protein ACFL59_00135 [Planctomycetota bacterium]